MRPEDKPFFDVLADWQLMGLCIEREASGEPREGRIAVGTVILERVDHRNWDGKTIHEVILMRWQFSWTMEQAGVDYYNKSVQIAQEWDSYYQNKIDLRDCADLAKDMIAGIVPRDPDLAAVNCCQYLNPITASKVRERWLALGMKSVKIIKHHEFFV